ncbi:MAG TPA: DUF5709 domain-containing protein [Jatrophihabitans sp.]
MGEDDYFGDSVYQSGEAVEDTDDLDPLETLTGDDPDEAEQTGYSPPEREPYNLSRIPTAFEQRQGESLDDHLAEEEPDVDLEDWGHDGIRPRAGRLVAPDEGAHADEESDEIATDVGPAGYASSAEEAAMHIVEDSDREW